MNDIPIGRSRDQATLDDLTARWVEAADQLRAFIESHTRIADGVRMLDVPSELLDQFGYLIEQEHKAEKAYVAQVRRFLGAQRGPRTPRW